jgi:hypothetical protein
MFVEQLCYPTLFFGGGYHQFGPPSIPDPWVHGVTTYSGDHFGQIYTLVLDLGRDHVHHLV